ncbi:MAG: hypothetical protein GW861_15005, partial [Deltaproteobacteria bacterium]|nr:hypothetical protein [Deltaproteobacteria bacterium]
VKEATGISPQRPPAFVDLEKRDKKLAVLPADVAQIKNYLVQRALS